MSNTFPEQNPPSSSADKGSYILWIVGGLAAAMFGISFYFLNRMDGMETKRQADMERLASKYEADHDRIVKIETQLEERKR